MSKDIEKLIKIQGAINKNIYHFHVETNLENDYRWVLYLYNPNIKDYFAEYNRPILNSGVDTIDGLIYYLENHEGFRRSFR